MGGTLQRRALNTSRQVMLEALHSVSRAFIPENTSLGLRRCSSHSLLCLRLRAADRQQPSCTLSRHGCGTHRPSRFVSHSFQRPTDSSQVEINKSAQPPRSKPHGEATNGETGGKHRLKPVKAACVSVCVCERGGCKAVHRSEACPGCEPSEVMDEDQG